MTDEKLYTSLQPIIMAKLTNHFQRTRLTIDSEDYVRSGCRNVSPRPDDHTIRAYLVDVEYSITILSNQIPVIYHLRYIYTCI